MAADFKEKLSEYPLANKFANFIVLSPYKALSVFIISFLILLPGILSIESMWSPRVWFDPDHQEIKSSIALSNNLEVTPLLVLAFTTLRVFLINPLLKQSKVSLKNCGSFPM